MKIDNGYFYNIEPVIDLDHFVELLLATLADKDNLYIIDTRRKRKAKLIPNYKEKIQKAMYSDEAINFLQLIDHFEYYERQSDWEKKLSNCLEKNFKKAKYNFEFDYIEFEYTTDEILNILNKYDEETRKTMNQFLFVSNLDADYLHYKRRNELAHKETKRSIEREYIRTSPTTFGNRWTK